MVKERITTILGIVLFAFGGFAIWYEKIPWIAGAAFFILGVTFIVSKDPKWLKDLISNIL